MKKTRIIFIIGIITILVPFLGIPNNWRKVVFFILGFLLMYCSYYLRLYIESLKTKIIVSTEEETPLIVSKTTKRIRKVLPVYENIDHEILS